MSMLSSRSLSARGPARLPQGSRRRCRALPECAFQSFWCSCNYANSLPLRIHTYYRSMCRNPPLWTPSSKNGCVPQHVGWGWQLETMRQSCSQVHCGCSCLVPRVSLPCAFVQVLCRIKVGQGRHYHGSRTSATEPVHGRAFPICCLLIVPTGAPILYLPSKRSLWHIATRHPQCLVAVGRHVEDRLHTGLLLG